MIPSRVGFLLGFFIFNAVIFIGCSDSGPDIRPIFWHDYNIVEMASVPADSVLLMVGTGIYPGSQDAPVVFIDTTPSIDEFLRLQLHVVGESYAEDSLAVVDHTWSGDTLRIWCGAYDPWLTKESSGFEKTSPVPRWFIPKRIDVVLPAGAGLRYLGRWTP